MNLSITASAPRYQLAPFVLQGDVNEQIRIAAGLGYHYVELHIRDPKEIASDSLINILNETGIKVSSLGTGLAYAEDRLYFSSLERAIRRLAMERIKAQIDLASELGAHVIIGSVKGPLPVASAQVEAAKERVLECVGECTEYAVRSNVQLTLEAINRYETNFLNTAAETVAFIQKIGSPALGLHLDTFHMNIEEVDMVVAIKTYSKLLVHIHLADSNRWAPGMGHLDLKTIVNTLRAVDYQGYLALECFAFPDPLEAAAQGLKHVSELLTNPA